MDLLPTIREFLKERLPVQPERVVPDARLKDLGVDSLMLLELIFECEERLNITIVDNDVTPRTIGDLIAFVERNAKAAATT